MLCIPKNLVVAALGVSECVKDSPERRPLVVRNGCFYDRHSPVDIKFKVPKTRY
jgi:hypothetical protein